MLFSQIRQYVKGILANSFINKSTLDKLGENNNGLTFDGNNIEPPQELTSQQMQEIKDAFSGMNKGAPLRMMHYSTEEQVVGTWTDGKPIWQRTWSGLSLTGTGGDDDTNIDISFVDRLICGVANRGGSSTAAIGTINFKKGTNNHLLYNETQGFANVDTIILCYTKITDTPQ